MELGWSYESFMNMTEQELSLWYNDYIGIKQEQKDYIDSLKD